MLAESHALLVLLQVKLLVVVTWADRNDPIRLQLGSTGNSSASYGSYGNDWAAICHQAMHTVIVTKHKMPKWDILQKPWLLQKPWPALSNLTC